MENPKLSVCIPVYNCEKFIADAIDSVFAQTFGNFELVVLDNHSTDKTGDIVKKYDDPRLRVIQNAENIGAEANWNLAISEARGKYVKILCADDTLYPECLEKQYRILEEKENEYVILVCCARNVINKNSRILMKRGLARDGKISGINATKKVIRAGTNLIGEPSAVLFRKTIVRQVGGFDGTIPYVIDLDLWIRMLAKGNLYAIAEPLCCFRVAEGSWSMEIRKKQRSDFNNLIDKVYADERYEINIFDFILGKCNAAINAYKRNLFYKFIEFISPMSPDSCLKNVSD
jgi:glycosyltransferase involved in cell wall biosynthesis